LCGEMMRLGDCGGMMIAGFEVRVFHAVRTVFVMDAGFAGVARGRSM
jgi:hypothetical protein